MIKNKSIQKMLTSCSVLMALSVAFLSCRKDNEVTDPVDEASALTVSVAEGDGTVALNEGTTVDLFAIEGGSIVAQSTVTSAQHGQLTGAEAITAVMKDGILLTGYTPSGLWNVDTYGQPKEFTVLTDQSTMENYEASDLRMAPFTAVTNGRAALVMDHVMTKVSVHLTDVTGNYDLSTVEMVMPGLHTAVTADLAQHTAATVENKTGDIIPYSPGNTPYRATAMAVVAPGKVAAGNVLVRVIVNGKNFTYELPEDADWLAGAENVYSMRLTSEGLAPYGSYVTAWGDAENDLIGNLEEVPTYGIGDYLLTSGKFVKADQLTEEQAADVVAVVFSDVVSEEDAAEGYNAYAMGLECIEGKNYGIVNLVGDNVQDYSVAFADLNGRMNTEKLMAGAEYQGLPDKTTTVFGSLDTYTQDYPLPASVASGWFVPSFGQMMQLLNNLGQAGLTTETEVVPSNYNPFYTSSKVEVFDEINASVEAVTDGTLLSTEAAKVYATSTEAATNFWCVQSRIEGGSWQWCFGRNPGRSGGNRTLLPCAAVKLPE